MTARPLGTTEAEKTKIAVDLVKTVENLCRQIRDPPPGPPLPPELKALAR
jgi:hypothetical protein